MAGEDLCEGSLGRGAGARGPPKPQPPKGEKEPTIKGGQKADKEASKIKLKQPCITGYTNTPNKKIEPPKIPEKRSKKPTKIKKNRNADASAETSKMKGYWVRLAARQKEQRTTAQMVGGETENLAGIDFRNSGTQGKLSNKPQVVSDINALI